jgi:LruC domain-containing protein
MTCDYFEPVPYTFDVSFEQGLDTLSVNDFDFFLYRTQDRSLEIHLADYPPTDKFDTSRFGNADDTSSAQSGRYFRTAENLPWALMISNDWHYPREYLDVIWAYPAYETWVESSGEQAQDWFMTNERTTHTFSAH